MKSASFLQNMSTFIFIGVMIVVGVIFALLLAFLCKDTIANFIMTKVRAFRDKAFFENSIKANTGTYLKTAISFAVFLRTVNYNAGFGKVILCMSPLILVGIYPLFATFILFCMKKQLPNPLVRKSIGQLYNKVDLKKGNWALMFYPLVLLRRLIFTIIPFVVVMYPWSQV